MGRTLLVSVLVSTCTHARICEFAHYLVAEIVYSCCVPLVRGPKFRRSLAFCRQPCVHIHKRHYSFRNQDLRCMIYYYCSCTIHIRVHLSVHPCVHTKPNAHNQQRRYPGLRWASFQWTSGESLSSAPFHRANRSSLRHFTVPTESRALGSRRRGTRIRIVYVLRTQRQ